MISISGLFEVFWHGIKIKVRKKNLPSQPTKPFTKDLSKIKKMNSKFNRIIKIRGT